VAQEADTEESGTVLYDDLDAGRLSTPHFDVMVACDPLLSPAFRYRAMTRWEEAYVNVAPRLEGSDCELSI
jgi:hypothetical protein